jgi:predicted PurR-regulated permease PerM
MPFFGTTSFAARLILKWVELSERNTMSYRSPEPGSSLFDAVAPWLRVLGVRSWLFLGIAAFMSVVFSVLSAISGIIVPLVFAIVIGMLFYPVVDMLARYGVPRVAGSMLVALLLLAVVVAVLWMMVVGILQQTGTISREITAGIAALKEWLISLNLSAETVDQLVRSARSAAPGAAAGLASFFTSSFSSVIAFLVGLFLGLVLLFYLLYDWHSIMGWVACHLSVPEDLGAMLVKDATSSIRL